LPVEATEEQDIESSWNTKNSELGKTVLGCNADSQRRILCWRTATILLVVN